jgi:hypothetical protein
MAEEFLSWRRPALSALIESGPDPARALALDGRVRARLPLQLDDGGGPVPTPVEFVLTGPQDVVRLAREAILTRRPTPGASNVETTHAPYVELADADLPWRYSPVPNEPAGVRPWLVLLVGKTGDELTVQGETVMASRSLLDEHDLAFSASWAHVHRIQPDPARPEMLVARVLSPRAIDVAVGRPQALQTGTDYTAALVPAWVAASDAKSFPPDAWPSVGADQLTRLPCFDSWAFRTSGEEDDFRMIAERLEPLDAAEDLALQEKSFGVAAVDVGPAGSGTLDLGGAITTVAGPQPSPLRPGVATATSRMARLERTAGGRWVLGLPRYDAPWDKSPDAEPAPAQLDGWRKELHHDPRHRGVAGLGAWAGIAWQDRIADAAAAQAGAMALAAERIRNLGLGLAAARSQWRRRVPEEPQAALAVLAPMLRRLPTSAETTAVDQLAGRTAYLAPALFSSAARRMLRPRSGVARGAKRGVRRLHRLAGVAATTCPPAPSEPLGQRRLVRRLEDPASAQEAARRLQENARDLVAEAFTAIAESDRARVPAVDPLATDGTTTGSAGFDTVVGTDGDTLPSLVLNPGIPSGTGTSDGPPPGTSGTGTSDGTTSTPPRDDPERVADHLGELPDEAISILAAAARPHSECRPMKPERFDRFASKVRGGIDPLVERPVVTDIVLGGFTGLREPELAVPDFAPELDIPMWSFLKDNARDWLLPGGGDLPLDRVVAMATNPVFVDAFLVGANQQTLGELRRRNIPVTSGWTPLRRFWQRIDADGPATDIDPILDMLTEPAPGRPRWPQGSMLGDASHQREKASARLVIVLHTELFRRYPATQVYLLKNLGGDTPWATPPPVDDMDTHIEPMLSGTLHPELVFFGFPMSPDEAKDFWLVLEEPPPGYRFRAADPGVRNARDGGLYAQKTLDPPVRAFFGNLLGPAE